MVLILSTAFAAVILIGLVIQVVPVLRLIKSLGTKNSQPLADHECPPVAILLSLRGGDPFLEACLARLLEQDYPDYELFVALDNADDPAAEYLDRIEQAFPHAKLTRRIIPPQTSSCTLLNHNLARLVEDLDPRFEVVVLVDADAVTWQGWLRCLVQPLVRDPQIGGTSGNRWYTPDQIRLGTLARAVWNMGSVVQMATLDFPWGGSMAIRSDVAKNPRMLQVWRSAFTSDTPVYQIIRDCGKKYYFNPEIMVLNREDISFGSFWDWMPRQLLNGKLYHPFWMAVLAQAVLSSVLLLAALSTNLANLLTGNWLAFGILGGSLILFWVVMFLLFLKMNSAIERQASSWGHRHRWLTWSTAHKVFWVIPLVQVVYFLGILKSMFMKRVRWRGIDYVVEGPQQVKLLQYKPFVDHRAHQIESL